MKFRCGPRYTYTELWEMKKKRWQATYDKLSKWHRHFAWLPVKVSRNDCRWLEYVLCRGVSQKYVLFKNDYADLFLEHGFGWKFEYKPIEKE